MSCLYSCIVVDGHRRVETKTEVLRSLSVVLHSCSFSKKKCEGNIFKDGDVGGGDAYHVSCEYQLSHVCSVVLTWC